MISRDILTEKLNVGLGYEKTGEQVREHGDNYASLIANETLYQLSFTPGIGLQASMLKKFVRQAKSPSPPAERLSWKCGNRPEEKGLSYPCCPPNYS